MASARSIAIATIALTAVLVIALTASAADADGRKQTFLEEASSGEPASAVPVTVQYVVGSVIYSDPVEGENFALKSLEALKVSLGDGNTFHGWYVYDAAPEPPAGYVSATTYAAGSVFSVSDGTKLYAHITVDEYDVVFAYADGRGIDSYEKMNFGDVVDLPAPTADGADRTVLEFIASTGSVFAGWALGDLLVPPEAASVAVTGDAVYVAQYRTDAVLTFVVDGTITYTHTAYGIVIPTDPSKEGYSFKGWYSGDGIVPDLAAFAASAKENAVLTAVFEAAVYKAVFVADGAEVLSVTVRHGETVAEPKTVPVKEGFDFVRWDYDFSAPVSGDVTIKAVFEPSPVPGPTGLKDPVVQTLCIILGMMVLGMVSLGVWKRKAIRSALLRRLEKGKGNGGA